MADADERDPRELVFIKHPKLDQLGGPVPRRTLPSWATRGWEEADPTEAVVAQVTGEAQALSKLDSAELEEVARAAGLDPSSAKNKTELIEMIKKATASAV